MLDKIVMKGKLDFENEAPAIIRKYHLQECTKGEIIYYQSGHLANIEGIFITLCGSSITVKCSIHKLWSKWTGEGLDNSKPCRFTQARETLRRLLDDLGIDPEQVRVSYYEIGVNMVMRHDPLDYIREVQAVGTEKEFFNDANFEKFRQKTTEKSRNYKKVQKVYDKTFEAAEKHRTAGPNILRVETIYKRQGAHVNEFFDSAWTDKILTRFYRDWAALLFVRETVAAKGVKSSQLQKAREILALGVVGYLDTIKRRLHSGAITPKTYRGCREFARDWAKYSHLFTEVTGALENEYQDKLLRAFTYARN